MSLSALQEDLTIFTPSLMIRDSFHRSNVQRDSRELAKSGKLFCPHCYASNGELRTVFFRSGGELKRDHFFHPKSDINLICPYSPMTEKHINAQSWVADHLSRKYPDALVKKEMQLRKSKDELCRPDICVILPDGTKFAYEIQVSKITEYEVKNRTERLQSNGCKYVTWFFTDQSDSLLIQECLALKKQHHALICFNEDSSVDSISVTNLKSVRQSLLQKLWDDHCLRQADGWSHRSRFFDQDLYSQLRTDPAFKINMQIFSDVLTIESFEEKASNIHWDIYNPYSSKLLPREKNENPTRQKSVFDFFGEDNSRSNSKPKSYNLPMPHYVISHREGLESYGDSLFEAMEIFGGMSALYALKEECNNHQSFKDLYNLKKEKLTFGDDEYGFTIFKGSLAVLLEEANYFLENTETPYYVVLGNQGSYGRSLSEAMNDLGGMDVLYCYKNKEPENIQFFKDLYNPEIKKLSLNDGYIVIYKDELADKLFTHTYGDQPTAA
jgi:hypothetical protein